MKKSHENGFFCVLLGPDGVGKSSLLKEIRSKKTEWSCVSADPEILYPISGLDYMNWALEVHPRSFVPHMQPLTRSLFYMKTIAMEYEYHIAPALLANKVVVCDSYYYRYLAKERFYNPVGAVLFENLSEHLPSPDLILWLNIPLSLAFKRKGCLNPYEVDGDYSETGFIRFQTKILNDVRQMIGGLPMMTMDMRSSTQEASFAIIRAIQSQQKERIRDEEIRRCCA